ncbi:MAG: extracellular solute-binding protein [Clostridia bacterium]|nr:extracellular solute-binding protein [Clostridia bacterium]
MKKWLTNAMALTLLAGIGLSATACGVTVVEEVNENQTQLYVANYSGGAGSVWLDNLVERFEECYKDEEFEPGKKGVQVFIDHDKRHSSTTLVDSVKMNMYEVYFAQDVRYRAMLSALNCMDITDVVKNVNVHDNKTIESKLYASDKAILGESGKYYMLPHYEVYQGINYDAGLFASKNLYFSDRQDEDSEYPGTNAFVLSATDKKSCGPDGVFDTYDDGLPSTYDEFYKLMDKMVLFGITPFVFNGESVHYTNMLMAALASNYVGADGWGANFDYDSDGTKIEIVTDFNDTTPNVEEMAITLENANKIKSSLGVYYASEFCHKVFSGGQLYDTVYSAATYTHLDAMERFMRSGLDGKSSYVGMLIDGSYWYNEASEGNIFAAVKNDYDDLKDVRFMPLPHQYKGTVTPRDASEALTPVISNVNGAFSFISANTPENHVKVAKTFLSYVYSDEQLLEATKDCNGIARGVMYDMSSVESGFSSYAKSVFDMRDAAQKGNGILNNLSMHPLYQAKIDIFRLASGSDYWMSKIPGKGTYNFVFSAFKDGKATAKEYFLGLKITDEEWRNDYLTVVNG